MKIALLQLILTVSSVAGFCPVVRPPHNKAITRSSSLHLATSNHDFTDSKKENLDIHKEVSRRVALVMAAATVAAAGSGLPAALAFPLSAKVESIEYENLTTVNSNGAPEKHLPTVSVDNFTGKVKIVVPHVMDPEKPHYIEYIWLKDETTGKVIAAKKFEPTDPAPPTLIVSSPPKGTKVRALLYCNLHGLWQQNEPITV